VFHHSSLSVRFLVLPRQRAFQERKFGCHEIADPADQPMTNSFIASRKSALLDKTIQAILKSPEQATARPMLFRCDGHQATPALTRNYAQDI